MKIKQTNRYILYKTLLDQTKIKKYKKHKRPIRNKISTSYHHHHHHHHHNHIINMYSVFIDNRQITIKQL